MPHTRFHADLADLVAGAGPRGINAAAVPAAFQRRFGFAAYPDPNRKLKEVLHEAAAAGVVQLKSVRPKPASPPVLMVLPPAVAPAAGAAAGPGGARQPPPYTRRANPVVEITDQPFVAAPRPAAVEVVLSFDTTGSMYGYLDVVRRNLGRLIKTLVSRVPGIRIGVIAHGDYCDAATSYVIKFLPLMTDYGTLERFVAEVGRTGGGNAPEAYEMVLNKANKAMGWSRDARARALVLVGDANPHEPGLR